MLTVGQDVSGQSQSRCIPYSPSRTGWGLCGSRPRCAPALARSAPSVPASPPAGCWLPCRATPRSPSSSLTATGSSLTSDTGSLSYRTKPQGTEDEHLRTLYPGGGDRLRLHRFRGQGLDRWDYGKCSSTAGAARGTLGATTRVVAGWSGVMGCDSVVYVIWRAQGLGKWFWTEED